MQSEFLMDRRVQFAETDIAGVLHFSNYYRLMEEAECAFWRSIGLSVITPHGHGTMSWPRVATSCEYFTPAFFEDELQLALRVARVGERSVTFEVEFRRGTERIALSRVTAVCCETKEGTFQPISIPEFIRDKLKSMLDSGIRSV